MACTTPPPPVHCARALAQNGPDYGGPLEGVVHFTKEKGHKKLCGQFFPLIPWQKVRLGAFRVGVVVFPLCDLPQKRLILLRKIIDFLPGGSMPISFLGDTQMQSTALGKGHYLGGEFSSSRGWG